jgi:hypothetical protein
MNILYLVNILGLFIISALPSRAHICQQGENAREISEIFKDWAFDKDSVDLSLLSKDQAHYIHPNEGSPSQILELPAIHEASVDDGLLAVGTERGFILAALKKAKYLVLADYDRYAVLYNRINIALLLMSESIADYRDLRLTSDFDAWQQRSADFATNQPTYANFLAVLREKNSFDFWVENVRLSEDRLRTYQEGISQPNHQIFFLNRDPEQPLDLTIGRGGLSAREVLSSLYFKNANYLYDVVLFNHLQMLAKNKAIIAGRTDLGALWSLSSSRL